MPTIVENSTIVELAEVFIVHSNIITCDSFVVTVSVDTGVIATDLSDDN